MIWEQDPQDPHPVPTCPISPCHTPLIVNIPNLPNLSLANMKKNFKTQAINSHDWWLNPYVCWFISPTSNSIDSAAFKRCHELLILRVSPHHLPLRLTRLHQHQLNLARWVVTPAKTTTLLKSKSSLSRGQSNGWKSGCVFLELTIAGWWKCETYIGMDQDCGMDHDGSKNPHLWVIWRLHPQHDRKQTYFGSNALVVYLAMTLS